MIINTMLVGHVVTASVTKVEGDTFHGVFMYHTQTGNKQLCLDFGQNWYVKAGEVFKCQQIQIDRANEYLKTMLPGDGLGDWSAVLRLKKSLAS